MRAVFSLAGILVVLLVIGLLVRAQMRPTPPPPPAQAELPVAPVVTPANARQVQEQIRSDLERALQSAHREIPE